MPYTGPGLALTTGQGASRAAAGKVAAAACTRRYTWLVLTTMPSREATSGGTWA